MMQGITTGMQMVPPPRHEAKMTSDQSEKLSTLLEAYDSETLSDEDAKSLVSEIKDLGIQPGTDLAAALGDAGIDARGLAEQAGIGKGGDGGPPPPPPGGGQGPQGAATVDDAIVSLVSDAVASYETSDDETLTLQSFLEAAMEAADYDTSQPLISFYA